MRVLADVAPAPPAATGRVGAVVLGGDYQGLGVVRSLGRRGVPVLVLDDERSIAGSSRYAAGSVRVPTLREERDVVGALLALARERDVTGWVLYPTREEMVAAVSRCRPELGRTYRVSTPPWPVARLAWDKRETYALAARHGIRVPRTWYPTTEDELDAVDLDRPVVLKPAVKEHFIYATGVKGWRADSPAELRRVFRLACALLPPGEVVVQELVPGGSASQVAHCALVVGGRQTAWMTVRRRRQHPPELGRASTFVETVDLPEVARLGEQVLRAMGYEGLAEVEFVQDPRDGQYALLDVNARTWGYHSLGAAAGVDFAYALFRSLVPSPDALPAAGGAARPGVRWVRLLTDVPTGLVLARRREVSLRDWARSLRGVDTEAVLALDDPLPFLTELALAPYLLARRGW